MARTAKLKMKSGWWMPEYEKHLPEWMEKVGQTHHGRLCYQAHKYHAAMKYVANPGVAIDVGGHIGLWSFLMAHDFKHVVAFEPMEIHRKCYDKNLDGFHNVELHEEALGAYDGSVSVETRTPDSSGDTGIAGDGELPMIALDGWFIHRMDFMKIDCEGYELAVLQGAANTIARCKPVIIVEQKGTMSEQYGFPQLAAVEFLKDMGMIQKDIISGDHIMAWL